MSTVLSKMAATTVRRSRIIGCGSYLPKNCVTNDELAKTVETSHEWIFQRTGIKQRHICAEDETTADLATRAAMAALEDAKITGKTIDLIVLATTTPSDSFPATATVIQHRIQSGGFAFDIQAVCSGFIYAMGVADSLICSGQANRALVIGAECFTRLLDWSDRNSCVLFGDGAGAVVLEATYGDGTLNDRGILSSLMRSDGDFRNILYVDGGAGSTGTVGKVRMEGKEVFRQATEKLAAIASEILAKHNLTHDDIDWLVPHQANQRIIEATARKLGLSMEKVVSTVAEHANCSAASIPLALTQAVRDGRIKEGQLLLLEALGGGLTWGSQLVRF